MACLRGISKRVNDLLQRRLYPSCGYHRFGDDKDETKPVSSPNPNTIINKFFPHIGAKRLGSVFLERQYQSFVQPLGFGFSSYRFMSSTPAEFVATKAVSDPEAMAKEIRKQEENKTTLLLSCLFKGYFVLFFPFMIMEMAHKVPSFETGTLWLTDLTIVDTTSTSFIFNTLIVGTIGAQLLLLKDVRAMYEDGGDVFKVCLLPLGLSLMLLLALPLHGSQNVLNCYYLTCALFFIGYGVVIRRLAVRKLLNLYDVTFSLKPSSSSSKVIKNNK